MQRRVQDPGRFSRAFFGGMACVLVASLAFPGIAPGASEGIAAIGLYRGADRERRLIEGAKKEGEVVFYNSNTWMTTVAQEFEKKFPFLKVSIWRSSGPSVIKRVSEEYKAGRFLADVIESSTGLDILQKLGFFQEYYSPELDAYDDDAKAKGKTGVFYLANREIYLGLGINTRVVPPDQAPKTYADLLDPKWKGKMALAGGASGPRWVGHVLNVMGRDYLEKLSKQDIKVHDIVPAALANLIISGEIPLSPTTFDSNVVVAKRKGATIAWIPLEPVLVNVGASGLTSKAPHPHAALLFLDYLHSKEGQEVVQRGGLGSPRLDLQVAGVKFKKTYLENQYSTEEFQTRYTQWEELMRRLFLAKR